MYLTRRNLNTMIVHSVPNTDYMKQIVFFFFSIKKRFRFCNLKYVYNTFYYINVFKIIYFFKINFIFFLKKFHAGVGQIRNNYLKYFSQVDIEPTTCDGEKPFIKYTTTPAFLLTFTMPYASLTLSEHNSFYYKIAAYH